MQSSNRMSGHWAVYLLVCSQEVRHGARSGPTARQEVARPLRESKVQKTLFWPILGFGLGNLMCKTRLKQVWRDFLKTSKSIRSDA